MTTPPLDPTLPIPRRQQDGSSDGTSSLGKQISRNARKDKHQRGGDYDLAGLLKKLANIGVDDLRRQLKNPLKDSQVYLVWFLLCCSVRPVPCGGRRRRRVRVEEAVVVA